MNNKNISKKLLVIIVFIMAFTLSTNLVNAWCAERDADGNCVFECTGSNDPSMPYGCSIDVTCVSSICAPPVCGNGVLEAGEICDLGSNNAQTCTATYNSQCTYCDSKTCEYKVVGVIQSICGNGNKEPGEFCDEGTANGACTPITGSNTCQYCDACKEYKTFDNTPIFNPICGNGISETGEECDDGNDLTKSVHNYPISTPPDTIYGVDKTYCSTVCEKEIVIAPKCGDGTVNSPNEDCEASVGSSISCTASGLFASPDSTAIGCVACQYSGGGECEKVDWWTPVTGEWTTTTEGKLKPLNPVSNSQLISDPFDILVDTDYILSAKVEGITSGNIKIKFNTTCYSSVTSSEVNCDIPPNELSFAVSDLSVNNGIKSKNLRISLTTGNRQHSINNGIYFRGVRLVVEATGVGTISDISLKDVKPAEIIYDATPEAALTGCCPSDYCWNGTVCVDSNLWMDNASYSPIWNDVSKYVLQDAIIAILDSSVVDKKTPTLLEFDRFKLKYENSVELTDAEDTAFDTPFNTLKTSVTTILDSTATDSVKKTQINSAFTTFYAALNSAQLYDEYNLLGVGIEDLFNKHVLTPNQVDANGYRCVIAERRDVKNTPDDVSDDIPIANWTKSSVRYDWNYKESGYCGNPTDCFVGYNTVNLQSQGDKTHSRGCIPSGEIIDDNYVPTRGNHYCHQGNWTTKTFLIASLFQNISKTDSSTGGDERYTLACYDNLNLVYNNWPLDVDTSILSACVLTRPQDSNIMTGIVLAEDSAAQSFINTVVTNYKDTYDISEADIDTSDCLSSDPDYVDNNEQFALCVDANGEDASGTDVILKIYYNVRYKYFIVSNERITAIENPPLLSLIWNSIKGFFIDIFTKDIIVIPYDSLNYTTSYDRLYILRDANMNVTGIEESKYDEDKERIVTVLYVKYSGLNNLVTPANNPLSVDQVDNIIREQLGDSIIQTTYLPNEDTAQEILIKTEYDEESKGKEGRTGIWQYFTTMLRIDGHTLPAND